MIKGSGTKIQLVTTKYVKISHLGNIVRVKGLVVTQIKPRRDGTGMFQPKVDNAIVIVLVNEKD